MAPSRFLISSREIKPGTKLIRTWKKDTHEVMALEDGFAWKGARYSSLSTIAKTITGTSWNGWKFFGLKGPVRKDEFDARGRFKRPKRRRGKVVWLRTRQAIERKRVREAADALVRQTSGAALRHLHPEILRGGSGAGFQFAACPAGGLSGLYKKSEARGLETPLGPL